MAAEDRERERGAGGRTSQNKKKQSLRDWLQFFYYTFCLIPFATYFEQQAIKNAAYIVVVSEALKDTLLKKGISKDKVIVVPNGVDDASFYPRKNNLDLMKRYHLSREKVILGFIGTFGPWHGTDFLTKAIIKLSKDNKTIFNKLHFIFIGQGNLKPLCQSLIEEDGLDHSVLFIDSVAKEQVPDYLSLCDVFLNPTVPNPDGTIFFGSPTKLFEYLGMGKPVISSDVGQMGALLEHLKTAYLFEGGREDALIDAIIKLSLDEMIRTEIGMNGYNLVKEKYTWMKHVEKIKSFILEKNQKNLM